MIIPGIVASQQAGAFTTPPATSADWRLIIRDVQSGVITDKVQIAGVVWLDAAGDPISTTGATFFASNWEGSDGPDKAFDGDPDTYWSAFRDAGILYGPSPFVQTTFTGSVEVRGVKVTTNNLNLNLSPKVFEVQFKTPHGAWLSIFKVYEQDQWVENEERLFQLNGRVWRLVINTTDEGSIVTIGELEFRSVANVAENHFDDLGFPLVSSYVPPNTRFNAFDNDNVNFWSTNVLPAYIEYWFPTAKAVEQVALFTIPGREDEAPATTQLFYSDNFGLTYTEVVGVDIINISGGYGYGYGYFYGDS